MKKITFVIACMLAIMSARAQDCTAVVVPYSENFESATPPALPVCTTGQNVGTGNNWTTSVPGSNGFTTNTLTYLYSLEAANAWFYTKGLNLTGGTSYRLTYKYGNNGYAENLKVAFGSANNAAAMVTVLADQPGINNPDGPLTKTIDFTPATTGTYYIGFNVYSIGNQNSLFIDDITVNTSPACIEPTAVTLSNTLENATTISWTAASVAPASGYDYYISTSATAPTAGTTATGSVAAGVLTATAGSLTSSTDYYVWVRSNCGSSSYSEWTGPAVFTTQCDYGEILTTTAATICGQGLSMLSATANDGAVIKWYNAATGGNQIGQGPTAAAYVTQTTTVYVSASNGDCESPRQAVLVTVTPATPIVATAANPNICTGGTTTLSVTSTNTDYTYAWFPGNIAGATLSVTPAVTTTYTVFATDAAANCSIASSVTVTVNPIPSAINITPATAAVCAQQAQALSVVGGTLGGEATIGTATTLTGDYEIPTAFLNRYPNYWSQTIYTAAELTAAGLTAGNIISMAYNIATPGSSNSNTAFTVKIGTTASGSFADNTYMATTGFTTVFGPATYSHSDSGWQVITFSTPYAWDGVSNIIVDVKYNGVDQSTNSQTYYTETAQNMVISEYGYSAGTLNGSVSLKRPNVKFVSYLPTTVTWTPAEHLYTNAAATTPYVAGTAATTVYFRSATVGTETITATATSSVGCTSTGTVSIAVSTTDAPTATATQSLCGSGTVANLSATGTNIQWYAAATGGTALTADTALTATTYYASQTVNGCESPRVPVTIQLNVTDAPTGTATQSVCGSGTVANLTATGTAIQWYAAATGGTALTADTALAATTYYASQTINGCESAVRFAVTVQLNVTDAPTGTATQSFCISGTVANLTATGTAIQWYAAATGGTALTADTALTATTYYASQTVNGCESAVRFAVTVQLNVTDAPTATATQSFCSSGTVANLTATGTAIQWYAAATGGTALTADTAITATTYYASQTVNGCESAVRTAVTVTLNNVAAPTGAANQTISVAGGDTATLEDIVVTATGTVTWYATEAAALAGEGALPAGTVVTAGTTYYATQTINGCTSTAVLAVTIQAILGNTDFDAHAFVYYPNPVSNVLTIEYSANITSVSVSNLLGQQILSAKPNATNATIDMANLAQGTYMVTVNAGAATKVIKVVKN
ncbi:T9SS type A sorting domain-containing protein [Flavobacterium subsaxonicum]|uniref:Ig-like domain-containing protein n=1 Tax=Flavobacterium subsaxonicum TaxID=426226 RepID=UPI000428C9B1|nr:T9SS type A sorting domain-containing protein [Flavobacterium subsaxonicum]